MRSDKGLTLIEVLVAVAILGVISTLFASSMVSSLSHTRSTASQIDATSILNYVGRVAAGGASRTLPFSPDDKTKTWDYGKLTSDFPEIKSGDTKIRSADLYKVTVSAPEIIAIGSAQVVRYALVVCWRQANADKCISGDTAGPMPSLTDPSAFNPVSN